MIAGNNTAAKPPKMAESRQKLTSCPLLLTFDGLFARK